MDNNRVEHPSHYTWLKDVCGIEVIDITRNMNFNLGNCIKYILRQGRKAEQGYNATEKALEDLKKAKWYLEDEIKRIENNIPKKPLKSPISDIPTEDTPSVNFKEITQQALTKPVLNSPRTAYFTDFIK